MKKPVIAIDGFSSTGKSSISKIIAEKLGIVHLDTGALYRGITWFALQNCMNEDGTINLPELFKSFHLIELEFIKEEDELIQKKKFVDNEVNKIIRNAVKEFDGDYDIEELRLMRIKFISEVAN